MGAATGRPRPAQRAAAPPRPVARARPPRAAPAASSWVRYVVRADTAISPTYGSRSRLAPSWMTNLPSSVGLYALRGSTSVRRKVSSVSSLVYEALYQNRLSWSSEDSNQPRYVSGVPRYGVKLTATPLTPTCPYGTASGASPGSASRLTLR